MRSPRKVTLLSLFPSGRQVVVYADERLNCISGTGVNDAQTVWIVYAHRDDGKRFVVRADEKLTAFMELEAAIWKSTVGPSARGLHFG